MVNFPLRTLDTEELFLNSLDRNDHDVLWRTQTMTMMTQPLVVTKTLMSKMHLKSLDEIES